MIALALAAALAAWHVGQEREVDAGYYARLISQENGWRVWRLESKDGVICQAMKSPIGKPHPVPLGSGLGFSGGTPYLQIWTDKTGLKWGLSGMYWREEIEFRHASDRFWSPYEEGQSFDAFDGDKIEVHSKSWEYPDTHVGLADEYGVIDLSGLRKIEARLKSCV